MTLYSKHNVDIQTWILSWLNCAQSDTKIQTQYLSRSDHNQQTLKDKKQQHILSSKQ